MSIHPTSLAAQLKGKRVGLVLSAGYFGFFGHAGFLRAVKEAGIEISWYGGTSAGALVAAMAASGMETEAIGERICEITRGHFWDPDPVGAVRGLVSGRGATGLLRGNKFRELLTATLPVRTFEECRKPLLVVAANLSKGAAQVFTRGELAPRVQASCAYPGLFQTVEIDGDHFWDGGLVDKAPVLAMHEAFQPDAILVHYLPSRGPKGMPRGVLAYAKAIEAAMAALRRDHFDLQIELLRRAAKLPVGIVTSELPELGPGKLHEGRAVMDQAKKMALHTLTRAMTDIPGA